MPPTIVQIFTLPASRASGLWTAYQALCRVARAIDPNTLAIIHTPKAARAHALEAIDEFQIAVTQHHNFVSLRRAAIDAMRSARVFHFHGCWTMAGILPLFLRKPEGINFIHSPHGTLAPDAMAHRAWKKRPFWHLVQKPALNRANILHATSQKEAIEIRATHLKGRVETVGLPTMPIALRDPATPRDKTVLFLGRLHPIKGPDLLIEAWADVEPHFPDWTLVIAGPDGYPGFRTKLENDVAKFGLRRVEFIGAIFGDEKIKQLQSASIVAVPSRSENFGYVVQEALAAGTPVLTTTGTPWRDLEEQGLGWVVEVDAKFLAQTLKIAMDQLSKGIGNLNHRNKLPENILLDPFDSYSTLYEPASSSRPL